MRKTYIASAFIIFAAFAIGAYLYPQMPAQMASHWNFEGIVDGHMPRFWGLFLMPIISSVMILFFAVIPHLDPLHKNIETFQKYYDYFVLIITSFLFYLYGLTLIYNIGVRFSMIRFLAPAFAILFYYLGVMTEHSKQNWFIGIRTPWTLSSEKVWDRTHEVGGNLFKLAGLVALLGGIVEGMAIFFVIVPVITFALYLLVYSYILHRKYVKH